VLRISFLNWVWSILIGLSVIPVGTLIRVLIPVPNWDWVKYGKIEEEKKDDEKGEKDDKKGEKEKDDKKGEKDDKKGKKEKDDEKGENQINLEDLDAKPKSDV